MAKQKQEKTNVMRILAQKKIPYTAHFYAESQGPEGTREYGVHLDLKKAAKAVGEKSIELLHVSEINAITGYIRGGCSPVGMKKQYPTVFHETALDYDTIYISGGRIGAQVELAPRALLELLGASTADIIMGG